VTFVSYIGGTAPFWYWQLNGLTYCPVVRWRRNWRPLPFCHALTFYRNW